MLEEQQLTEGVHSNTEMKKVFREIRRDVNRASARSALTDLYRRAGGVLHQTSAPDWQQKFGPKADTIRKTGEDEFRKTARKINRRAVEIGTEADYDERWGKKG